MEPNMRHLAPIMSAALLVLHGCAAPVGKPTPEEHMKAMSMMCGMGAQDGASAKTPSIK